MHICYVTNEYIDYKTLLPVDGGLGQYLSKITVALAKKGHDVSVICLSDKNLNLTWNNVDVYFLKSKYKRTMSEKLLKIFWSKQKKREHKNDYKYRLVHEKIQAVHQKKKIDVIQYASYAAMGKMPEKDIPSCVRISSYAKLWQKNYNYENLQEIENETKQFENAKFLYGPSKAIAEYIKNDLHLKQEIKIIETPFVPYSGAENDELYDNLTAQIKNSPYLLFFGTIGLLKGALEIADSIESVLQKYPDLCLVLVGKQMPIDGRSPVQIIKEKAGKYADRVIWYDRQPHETLLPLIRHAKAVLLPSRIDNLPNACIEAMGLKKLVIGAKGASFEQLIDDEKSGLLCETGNAESIVKAVDKLMNMSPAQIQNIEQKAYERSLSLSLEAIVPQVLDYYQYVIENWREK